MSSSTALQAASASSGRHQQQAACHACSSPGGNQQTAPAHSRRRRRCRGSRPLREGQAAGAGEGCEGKCNQGAQVVGILTAQSRQQQALHTVDTSCTV